MFRLWVLVFVSIYTKHETSCAPLHMTIAARSRTVFESATDMANNAAFQVAAATKNALLLNEMCEQHCVTTHGQFGCLLDSTRTIGPFASPPLDPSLSAIGCHCLTAELLCDRMAHCRNGSDERPDACARWNATKTCRSADFMGLGEVVDVLLSNHSRVETTEFEYSFDKYTSTCNFCY